MIDVNNLRKTSTTGTVVDWLLPCLDSDKETSSSNAVSPSATNSNSTPNGSSKVKKLYFLSERCAYADGVWDESPEDVLRSLTQTTALCESLVSVLASRLLTKNDSLAVITKNMLKMLQCCGSLQSSNNESSRQVIEQIQRLLQFNGLKLLSSKFLTKQAANTIEDKVQLIFSAFRVANNATMLWIILNYTPSKFSSAEILLAFDRYVSGLEVSYFT